MAISKIIYKSSAEATPETWMDATTATAAAANIIAPYTAMLADGIVTTGTGSGGGGGLTYEAGTYTPTTDTQTPNISFTNSHSTRPFYVMICDSTMVSIGSSSIMFWYFDSFYDIYGIKVYTGADANGYARINYSNKTSTGASTASTNVTSESALDNYVTSTGFTPLPSSSNRIFRSGRTYKWIAIWAPTT